MASGELLGPLVLDLNGASPSLQEIAPRLARSLCGEPLEWIEIVK